LPALFDTFDVLGENRKARAKAKRRAVMSHAADKGIAGVQKHTYRAGGVSGGMDNFAAYAKLGQRVFIVAQADIGFGAGGAMENSFRLFIRLVILRIPDK